MFPKTCVTCYCAIKHTCHAPGYGPAAFIHTYASLNSVNLGFDNTLWLVTKLLTQKLPIINKGTQNDMQVKNIYESPGLSLTLDVIENIASRVAPILA